MFSRDIRCIRCNEEGWFARELWGWDEVGRKIKRMREGVDWKKTISID